MFWSKSAKDTRKSEHRVALNEKMFISLVRGGQVTVKHRDGSTTCFILQDIGWRLMIERILTAQNEGVGSYSEESIEVTDGY